MRKDMSLGIQVHVTAGMQSRSQEFENGKQGKF